MKLSFVVPVYNVEKYLKGCIDSLYRQGLSNDDFEVICVNDGSTDDSGKILDNYAQMYNNFIVINQENSGQSSARNAGMDMAKGEYIRFIDSDDYISDNVVGKLLDVAISYDLDMLYTTTMRTDREDCFKASFQEYPAKVQVMDGKTFFYRVSTPNGACEYFVKRQFLYDNSFKFIEGKYCEDGMFTLSLLCSAKRVAKCNVDFYRYVKRAGSTVNNREVLHQLKMVDDFCYAVLYINRIIEQEKETDPNTEFIEELTRRRDSYTFFLQVRMVRSCIDISKIKEYINILIKNECYPNKGLAPHYGRKLVTISRLFNHKIFILICYLTRLPVLRRFCEKITL